MDALLADLRYAMRSIERRPGFAAAVVACFALGIGANATIFGVVDTLFFRPPAHVQEPDHVVRVYVTRTSPPFGTSTSSITSFAKYIDLRDGVRSFSDLAAYYSWPVSLGHGAEARSVAGGVVTHTFFPLLGVRPVLGRFFSAEEDRVGNGRHVAVLDYDFWRSAFGGDSSVLGRPLHVSNGVYTIIGVAPRGFTGVELNGVDIWLPIATADPELFGREHGASRGSFWLRIVGRLRSGASVAGAEAEATSVYRRANADESGGPQAVVSLGPIQQARGPEIPQDAKVSVWLAAVSAMVLLIACANVANLLLARAVQRKREIAVRLALGAARRQLVRQLLVETVAYAVLGALAAVVLTLWLAPVIHRFLLSEVAFPDTLTARVLGFTAAATIVVGIASGLAPALRATGRGLANDLKAGERERPLPRSAIRTALLVGQTALTIVLVVGSGLFAVSLRNVLGLDLGLDAGAVLLASPRLAQAGFKKDEINALYERMREGIRDLPGVQSVSLSIGHPFGAFFGVPVSTPGRDSLPRIADGGPYIYAVTPEYFRTLGMTIRRGRGFTTADRAGAPPVAVVSEMMARLVWPGEDAVGKCLKLPSTSNVCAEVVGVAANTRRLRLLSDTTMQYYVPLEQHSDFPSAVTALLIRTAGPADAMIPLVRRELEGTAENLPYIGIQPLATMFAGQVRPFRLGATMFAVFAVLAVLLAALGLYGVLAYTVARRTHEIGVRVSLGAEVRDVLGLVVAQGVRLAAIGVLIGGAGAVVGGRALGALLYGVSSSNMLVLGGSAAIMLVVAGVASYLPARRATKVDPMVALRYE